MLWGKKNVAQGRRIGSLERGERPAAILNRAIRTGLTWTRYVSEDVKEAETPRRGLSQHTDLRWEPPWFEEQPRSRDGWSRTPGRGRGERVRAVAEGRGENVGFFR